MLQADGSLVFVWGSISAFSPLFCLPACLPVHHCCSAAAAEEAEEAAIVAGFFVLLILAAKLNYQETFLSVSWLCDIMAFV